MKLKDVLKEDGGQRATVEKLSQEVDQLTNNPQALNLMIGYLLGALGMKGKVEIKDFEKAIESAKSFKK
jgi:hypothetical protein